MRLCPQMNKIDYLILTSDKVVFGAPLLPNGHNIFEGDTFK